MKPPKKVNRYENFVPENMTLERWSAVVSEAQNSRPAYHSGNRVVDAGAIIFTQSGPKEACKLVDKEKVFCPGHEVDNNIPVGNPSGTFLMGGPRSIPFIKCWSIETCGVRTFVVLDSPCSGFVPGADDKILSLQDGEFLNRNSRHIDFGTSIFSPVNSNLKLIFIDGPMGIGKTTCLKNEINHLRIMNANFKSIHISFRQGLSRFLATTFNSKCYLDKGFWKDSRNQRNCVVCINSISKLTFPQSWDVLILDECAFTQFQLVSDIMSKRKETLGTLENVMLNSKKIILMQHLIPEETIGLLLNLI